jgi:hypothetical protein
MLGNGDMRLRCIWRFTGDTGRVEFRKEPAELFGDEEII